MELHKINETVNKCAQLVDEMVAGDTEYKKNILSETKADYKGAKKECFIGTIIVLVICFGILFVRFRVFGG